MRRHRILTIAILLLAGGAPACLRADETPARREASGGHWAFQPVQAVSPPRVADAEWPRNPVDCFIRAALENRGLRPAPPASPAELVRRVFFDVTGLPPEPEDAAAFAADPSPEVYERLVDRLLASPRHGERWGQHWLDVARYAETEGFEYDRYVPGAWRFRDFVIDSLNADKPFDRFLAEQLAGDEISPGDAELEAASIFHRLGPIRRNAGNPDVAVSRNEVLTERTDIIGAAFLGLTVGCARCHDHKFDPIPQSDYYRLQAFLAATQEDNIPLVPAGEQAAWESRTRAISDEVKKLQKRAESAAGEARALLEKQIAGLEETLPAPLPMIPATRNAPAERTAIHVLQRGVWELKGAAVGPRPLGILASPEEPELPPDVERPRSRLAAWLARADHPLTARVIANRIWQHHFGQGIVKTANDFGRNGDRPSHPELLDWLAGELLKNGWRFKPLHRLLLLSATYRQSSRADEAAGSGASAIDPENRLLGRFNRRRLSAEEVRDAMLAASGELNLRMGGPGVTLPVDAELLAGLYKPSDWTVTADPREFGRRSVYLFAKRNLRLPFFEAFDQPALQTSCARRETSTHAPQALEMLNGGLARGLAGAFAARLERQSGGETRRLVDLAYRLAAGRPPAAVEVSLAEEFLRDQPPGDFALALFNLNAFIYVE